MKFVWIFQSFPVFCVIFPDFSSLFKNPLLFPDWKMPSHFSSPSGNPACTVRSKLTTLIKHIHISGERGPLYRYPLNRMTDDRIHYLPTIALTGGNNICPNISGGLNFTTYEQTLMVYPHWLSPGPPLFWFQFRSQCPGTGHTRVITL